MVSRHFLDWSAKGGNQVLVILKGVLIASPQILYLYAVDAKSLVTGAGVESGWLWRGGDQQTVDFVGVALKHRLAFTVL